jgi:hypothetical protein
VSARTTPHALPLHWLGCPSLRDADAACNCEDRPGAHSGREMKDALRALATERQKNAELAAALVDYQRGWVKAQQDLDEARSALGVVTQERDEARGEVLGLRRMLRERGVTP